MDGLRESADILFILTTNRPEMLEAALASRPGRVDQAIEFPLPDDNGREKLVRLYSAGAPLSEELVRMIVARTDKVSAAFIKELMRRAIQFNLERSAGDPLHAEDVNNALEEMLFTGGSLNIRLLGGAAQNGGNGSPAPM
jgi:ATP-dependent 26S proteasome regulatory subunit